LDRYRIPYRYLPALKPFAKLRSTALRLSPLAPSSSVREALKITIALQRADIPALEPLRAHIGRMAREKYESLLRCPMCGRTGLADMSDDKSHEVGDYDTRVEAVTQGFEIKGNDVICSVCQVSAL